MEEITKGERGEGYRGKRKAKRIEGKSPLGLKCDHVVLLEETCNFDHDAWKNV